jgi:hypothetical protein
MTHPLSDPFWRPVASGWTFFLSPSSLPVLRQFHSPAVCAWPWRTVSYATTIKRQPETYELAVMNVTHQLRFPNVRTSRGVGRGVDCDRCHNTQKHT